MFNNSNGFVMPVAPTGYGSNGGFGGFGDDWVGLIIILALLSGGFNGFGFGGGFGGGRGCVEPCATKADLTAQGIVQKLDGITYGITDSTYALNNSIMSGFHGVDNAICNLGYNVQSGFNGISSQLANCCCETQRALERGFADTNYNMATQSCEIKQAINDSTKSVIDFLVNDKLATLQAENQDLRLKASQAEQNSVLRAAIDASTAEVIRRTGNECPIPAYVVPNPNCCYNPFGFGYGGYGNNGCGCGCA